MSNHATDHLTHWNIKLAIAEQLVPLIGKLSRENNIELQVHGRSLVGRTPKEILHAHRHARNIDKVELPLEQTLAIAEQLVELNAPALTVDVAQVVQRAGENDGSVADYLAAQVAAATAENEGKTCCATGKRGTDVVLYGFGRIGRLLARIIVDQVGAGAGLNLRAIVVRKGSENDLQKRASLLRRDSVHGPFNGTIDIDFENDVIVANGVRIQVIYSNDPTTVNYTAYGINDAILVDNTGRWRDTEGLSQHLQTNGIARVLLTAPGKGELKNIVFGINDGEITCEDKILSAASCTTNAITPVLKVVNDAFGVTQGHVETVHSYTNDQNLIDNFHKGDRRGRSAALNMVITETGAAKAVAKALPELAGKLTGNAIRVPTPNVSLAILNLQFEKEVTREELNGLLQQISLTGELRNQIDFVEVPEIVSTDFVGSDRTGIVDGLATQVAGKTAILYVWYDNEFGYSCQVVRVVEKLAGLKAKQLPLS